MQYTGIVNPNLLKGTSIYTRRTPFHFESPKLDGFYYLDIFSEELSGVEDTEYVFSCCTNRKIANEHDAMLNGDTSDIGKVSFWLGLYDAYPAKNKDDYLHNINFNKSNNEYNATITSSGEAGYYHFWAFKLKLAAKQVRLRINTYSDGTAIQTADFWNFKLELGTKPTPWCKHVDD